MFKDVSSPGCELAPGELSFPCLADWALSTEVTAGPPAMVDVPTMFASLPATFDRDTFQVQQPNVLLLAY